MSAKTLITQSDFDSMLGILRVYFHDLKADHPTLPVGVIHGKLSSRFYNILRHRFPKHQVEFTVDMLDPEHPRVTIHSQQHHPTWFYYAEDDILKFHRMRSELCAKYGDRLGSFLTVRLAGMIRKHKLHKNQASIGWLRIARSGYPAHELEYQRIRLEARGTSVESEFEYMTKALLPWNRKATKWKIGFNYIA